MGSYTPLLLTVGDGISKNRIFGLREGFRSVLREFIDATEAYADAYDDLEKQGPGLVSQGYENDLTLQQVNQVKAALNQSGVNPDDFGIGQEIKDWIHAILGNDDTYTIENYPDGVNSRFAFHFQTAAGHVQIINEAINSAVNATDIASASFTSQDDLVTGNISLVCTDPNAFGSDLENTGRLFDFSDIASFGSPGWLFRRMSETNALRLIADDLKNGVYNGTQVPVDELLRKKKLAYGEQYQLHQIFQQITGKTLADILVVMEIDIPVSPTAEQAGWAAQEARIIFDPSNPYNVNAPREVVNAGEIRILQSGEVTSLADLYNLTRIFPNSWQNLQYALGRSVGNIFSAGGGVSHDVSSHIRLTSGDYELPFDYSKANKAFTYSMQRLKNILGTTPQSLAEEAKSTELLTDLDRIVDNTTPVQPGVRQNVVARFAPEFGDCGPLGTGPNGNLTLEDAMGSILGLDHIETLSTYTRAINNANIQSMLSEVVSFTSSASGTTSQADIDMAVDNIINQGSSAASSAMIEATAGIQVSRCRIQKEQKILGDAGIWNGTAFLSEKDDKFAMLFATAVHSYSTDEEESQFLEDATKVKIQVSVDSVDFRSDLNARIPDVLDDTFYGHAFYAALREGRNLQRLNSAGIISDTKIDDFPK